MPKFNVEYKLSVKNEEGTETRYAKKVIDSEEKFAALQAFFTNSEGLEFFVIRRAVEKQPVKKILKETK